MCSRSGRKPPPLCSTVLWACACACVCAAGRVRASTSSRADVQQTRRGGPPAGRSVPTARALEPQSSATAHLTLTDGCRASIAAREPRCPLRRSLPPRTTGERAARLLHLCDRVHRFRFVRSHFHCAAPKQKCSTEHRSNSLLTARLTCRLLCFALLCCVSLQQSRSY